MNIEGPLLDFAMRKYHGHRTIPPEMKDEIKDAFKVKEEKKLLKEKKRKL